MNISDGGMLEGRPRILLVDDDAAVRRSTQLLLQAQGFDVRAFGEGGSLVADGRCLLAACLITDYRMEGLDGIATLARLRRAGWNGPAILMTGYPSEALARKALLAGFRAVLEKPFRQSMLLDMLFQFMPGQRST